MLVMYVSLKLAPETLALIKTVREKFFSEFSFIAKGTIVSRSIEIFEKREEKFDSYCAAFNLSATDTTRLNLTQHAIEFINEQAAKNSVSKNAIIHAVLKTTIDTTKEENIINIMTWNINWFRGGPDNNWKYKDWEYKEEDIDKSSFHEIVHKVKKFLKKPNAICILQEVPYCCPKSYYEDRKKTKIYEELCEQFSKNEFMMLEPKVEALHQCIAIVKKETNCTPITTHDWASHRIMPVMFRNMVVVGVHMPTNFQEGDTNDKLWKNLIAFAENCDRPLCIAGDFNAYIGCNVKMTEKRFLTLLKSAGDITPNVGTYLGNTHVDHILLKGVCINNYQGSLQSEFKDSDHKYIEMAFV